MSRDDFYDSPFGALYSAYMERPGLSRLIGRILWGGDDASYYESMSAVSEVTSGALVVDCPCGAGPALRAVPADGSVRYLGVDLSPSMIRRARKRAERRDLRGAQFVEADATELPLAPESAELFLSYWGLHCFSEPSAALAEAARVLGPGGRLVGSSFVLGRGGLRRRLVRSGTGDFGRVGTQAEVEAWLDRAGFDLEHVSRSGPMLFFDATKHA